MYCNHCGKEISDNSKFCSECGATVSASNEKQMVKEEIVQDKPSKGNKKAGKKLKLWHIIVVAITVVAIIVSCIVIPKVFSRYDWNEVKLSSVLPEPESKWGDLSSNTKDYLYLYVHRTSLDEYNSYVAECVDKGFKLEAEKEDSSYIAFNADGYKLTLYYHQSDKKMTINVDAPIEMQTIQWATSNIAKLLPVPESTIGNIERNDEKGFSVYLGETSYLEYSAYVNECETNGFTVEFQKQDKYFSAKNADGYQLNVQYKGCNVIYISIIEPQKTLDLSFRSLDSEFEFSVYIDDSWELDVEKGETKTCNVVLGMGEHIIKVESDDDWDVYDNYVLTVTKDEKIKFDVCCTRNGIEIGLSGEVTIDNTTNSSQNDDEEKDNDASSSSNEPSSRKEDDDNNPTTVLEPYEGAVKVCQKIKNSLNNPDSLQLHEILHVTYNGCDYYYIDLSAMNKMGGYTRTRYYAMFMDGVLFKLEEMESFSYEDIINSKFDDLEYLDVSTVESRLK